MEPSSASVDLKWEGQPLRLQFDSADDHIAKVVRRTGTFYEIEMLNDVRSRLFFAKCAVDVGAHVGNHTVFFARALGLRTIAFEPNPASFRLLEANVAANALNEKCRLHNIAMGATAGRAKLRPERAHHNSGLVGLELASDGAVEVARLDDTLEGEPQIDVIKIDVEGFEVRVLEGGLNTITRHRPIIYIETKERGFAGVSRILAEQQYVCWKRFNFTPTFLFLPEERFKTPTTKPRRPDRHSGQSSGASY